MCFVSKFRNLFTVILHLSFISGTFYNVFMVFTDVVADCCMVKSSANSS